MILIRRTQGSRSASEDGPPITLGAAASASENAAIKSSLITPKWCDDTAPTLPFPSGEVGWFVPIAGATMSLMVTGSERR